MGEPYPVRGRWEMPTAARSSMSWKHEEQSTKHETSTKFKEENPKEQGRGGKEMTEKAPRRRGPFRSFRHSCFEFVSCFVLPISCFPRSGQAPRALFFLR